MIVAGHQINLSKAHVSTHHPSHVIFRCPTKVVLVLIPCVRATPEGSILVVLLGDGTVKEQGNFRLCEFLGCTDFFGGKVEVT